jgi:hypothetical protein
LGRSSEHLQPVKRRKDAVEVGRDPPTHETDAPHATTNQKMTGRGRDELGRVG